MPLTEQEKENVRATYDDSEVDNGAYDAYGPNVTNEMLVEQPEFIDENPPGESYWDDENTAEFHEYMNYVDEDTGNDRRFWGPEQVARYSNYIASQGDEYVDNGLLDVPGITAANDAYVRANPGKSWDQWSDNDETIALTTNLKTPPSEAVPEWDKKQATWSVVDEGMKQKGFTVQSAAEIPQNVREQYIKDQPAETLGTDKFYLPQNIAPKTGTEVMQPGELTPQKVGAMVAGMPEEQFNQLEPWKQWVLPFMTEFPILASTAMGAAAGAKLGPLGTVAGATAGGAMGWLQTQTNPDGSYKYPGLIDIFNKLDLPAEFLERAQGFAGMVISSLTDPKKYGPIGEVLNNLPESWDAAHLTYDVSFAPIGAVKDGKLYSDELNKPGQNVYELTPEQQDSALSSTMLTEARRRLVAGEAANDVYADIKSRFGFRGDTQDLLGHMVVDPLNVLPEATTKGIGKAAELTGHGTLAKATEMAGGPVSVIQEYSRIARTELDANQRAALAKNPVARWAAGFDKFSELSDYALPHEVGLDANGNPVKGFAKFTNPLDYLRGLDRPSKANNLLHNSIDGINQTMSMVEDFDGQVNQVFKLMDVTPQQTVDGLKATNLPIYAGSAEFQHVPTILKDLKPKVLDLQSQYHSFDGDRQALTKIAEGLGVEPYKLVNELHNSADGNVRYRQFIDTLAEKAAIENGLDITEFRKQLKNAQTPDAIAGIIPKGASGDLLRAILTDDSLKALSGKKLKIMADKFVGENAPGIGLTEDMAKARLQILLEDGIGAAAAKYFGVKPSNAAMRMSYLVKKAQGIALLGQNPTNFVNNALNNYITIGWDMGIGKLFGTSMKDIDEFNQRTGAVSSRNKEGGLVVGETAFEPLNSQISKARKGTDWIQGATDLAAKAGKNPLIAPFTKLSMNAEVNARKLAAYHGASEYINRMWVAGKGFTKVEAFDPSLKKLLDSAGVSIERFNKAIEGSRNNAEMTQRVADLLGGMEKPTVYDAWTPDEIELMRKSNVEAFNSLEKAVSDGDIDGAKKIYQDSILKAIRDQLEEDTFNTVHNAMLTGSAGGARGLSDFLTTMFARKADQLFHHRDFTAAMAEKARGAPDYESRAAIWREADRQANAEWGAYKQEESKQFLGLLRGMGVLDDIESGTMKLVGDIQLNEDAFYFSRSELFDTHTLTKFATDAERAADFERITQQLNGEYTDMLIEESHLQIELDNQLRDRFISTVTSPVEAKILGAQFDIWQGAKQQIRQKMGQQELLFRTGEVPVNILNEFGDLVPPEIKARILQLRNLGDKETYYNEIYRAGISEMIETNNRLSPGRTQVIPDKAPEVEAAAKPYQEQASQEMARSEVRKIAHDVANINNDVHLMNTVRKYLDPNLQSLNEVTPEMMRNALTARELAHRAPLDSMDRNAFMQGLRTAYNLDDAQLKQVMVFQDAIAKYMAEQKGVTPDDIFKAGFAEINRGDISGLEQGLRRYSKQEMIDMGADGYLNSATLKDIPVSEIDGLEPAPSMEESTTGRKITQPIEVGFDPNTQKYVLYSGNHRVQQALLNGDKTIPAFVDRNLRQGAKGSVDFLSDGRAVLKGLEAADISTAIHETGHVWLRTAPDADKAVITRWLKDEYGKELQPDWMMQEFAGNADLVDAHEKFARAMERYFTEGITPPKASKRLLAAFDRIKEWMTQIYREITGSQIDVKINPEMRAMLDMWMTGKRVELDAVKVVGERAAEMVDPKTPEYVKPESKPVDTKPATPEIKTGVQDIKTRARGDYSARLPRNFSEYPPAVQQAMQDWIDHKIYIQKGNLRYSSKYDWEDNRGGRIVSYNKEVKNSFKNLDEFTDILHAGTELLQQSEWTPETLTNYVNLLIKNNDPATLLQAVREEPIANRAKLLDAVGRQAPELASRVWRAMDRTGELYSDRISGYTRSLLQEMKPGEKLDGQSVPVGTVDSLSDMPKGHGMQEMYTAHIRPTLDKLDNLKNFKATPGVNVDPKLKAGITGYLDNVRQERADVNMGAIRHGEIKADFAMLNYGKQANWDNLLNVAMPYHFWYSRSIGNWGLRAIEKPKIYADYLRLQNFANNQTQEREGFPTRLKGKVGMHLSFLPEGFQDIYIDPNRQLFPFTQMVKPWEEYLTDQNRENKRAQTILQDMVDNGELEQADADTALQTMQGDNWNKAVSQARVELESDTSNPLDFAQTISGFSMPLSVLIAQASGRTDKLGMLPATRILRNITAAAGYDNYKGLDLSIKGLGGDAYQEGRIRSMLANMVANSEITLDEFNNALLTNSGGAYTKATQKVAYMNLAKTAVPGIGLDFYPEGEQKARAAQESYKSEAIPAFESGDTEAKRNFFEANPGLSARYSSFEDDPVKMRNKLLTNEVWDAYNKMPDLYQKQAREQLGSVFQDWMATKSTMSDSMLAGWAQAMGKMLPKEIDAANTPVKFAPPEAAKKVQSFYDAKKKAFPWSEQAWKDYYALPENSPQRTAMMNSKQFQQMFAWENAYKANHSDIIPYMVDSNDELFGVDPKIAAQVYAYQAEKYGKFPGKDDPNFSKWNNAYLAKHPDIVPFVIGKDNELKQLPKNVQSYVYQYRANRDQLFPGLLDNWDAAPQATKSKYLAWQKQIAGAFPEAAPYIVSDNTIRKGLGQPTLPYNPISMNDMSNELRGQYQDYIYSGTPITTGGLMELERLWKDAGKPEGNMQKYIDSLR